MAGDDRLARVKQELRAEPRQIRGTAPFQRQEC